MRRSIVVAAVLGALAAIGTLLLILYGAVSQSRYTCEVCITFHGRQACREALGATEQEATRTAIDNACALVAAGMTESVACTTRTPPDRVTCEAN